MNQEKSSIIIKTIIQGYNPQKIIVFGSYARNEAKENSDLDLLIIKETEESYYQRPATVRSIFAKQPGAMDILVYTPKEFEEQKSEINNIVNRSGCI